MLVFQGSTLFYIINKFRTFFFLKQSPWFHSVVKGDLYDKYKSLRSYIKRWLLKTFLAIFCCRYVSFFDDQQQLYIERSKRFWQKNRFFKKSASVHWCSRSLTLLIQVLFLWVGMNWCCPDLMIFFFSWRIIIVFIFHLLILTGPTGTSSFPVTVILSLRDAFPRLHFRPCVLWSPFSISQQSLFCSTRYHTFEGASQHPPLYFKWWLSVVVWALIDLCNLAFCFVY